jgi:hypothetical protein
MYRTTSGMNINRPSGPATNEEWRIFTGDTGIEVSVIGAKKDPHFAGLFCCTAGCPGEKVRHPASVLNFRITICAVDFQ